MPKSDDDRTIDVLEDWCGISPADFGQALIDLWEDTRNNPRRPHTSVDFQPDGVEDLIEKVKREFRNPPGRRITLTPRSFDPNGRVKTISDLFDAVGSSQPLDQAPVGTESAFAASLAAAIDDETARLFRVLKNWSGDFPLHVLEPLIEIWERTRASEGSPHPKVPFRGRGIQRLVRELKVEYRSGEGTIPDASAFWSDGSVRNGADLLRALHSPGKLSPASVEAARKRSSPKKRGR